MHALSVSLLRAKQLPVITNGLGASPHAGSTCTIGVVTVRPLNRLPARLYFKLKPDPNNTFFFIFTCTTQYPWVLANLNLSQAMAPSKKKRTHTVFRDSSAHRSASTSKPRFVGVKVRLADVVSASSERNKGGRCSAVYSVTNSQGFVPSEDYFSKEVYSKDLKTYRVVERNMIAYNPSRINVGSVALQDKCDEVVVSPLYVVFSVDESRVKPGYAVRFLKSKPGLDQIAFQSIGTVRNNLKFKALCQMRLKLPSLAVQEERLANLASIESQINQSRKAIEEFDQLAKSRFVEMFGSSSADSRYEVCRIGDIADVFVGVVIKPKQYYTDDHANGIKAFRSLNVGEMHVRDDDWVYFSKEGNKKAKKTQLHAGDVLVVRSGYPGTSCVVPLLYEGCNAVDLIIARSNSNNVLPEYIAAFNNRSHMKSLINQMSVGSAQKHFNIGFYRNVEIPLPPLSAQKEYVSFLRQVDKSRFVRDHEINFR